MLSINAKTVASANPPAEIAKSCRKVRLRSLAEGSPEEEYAASIKPPQLERGLIAAK